MENEKEDIRLSFRTLPRILNALKPGDFTQLFCLYSTWSFMFQLVYYVFGICVFHPATILSMATTCSLGGLVIAYDSPRYVRFKTTNAVVYIDGACVRILDFWCHHVPLYFWMVESSSMLLVENTEKKRVAVEMVGIPLIYRLFVNPCAVYDLDTWKTFVIVGSVLLGCVCLFLS